MSHKHLVLADVNGKIRFLSLTTNGPVATTRKLAREMADMLFAGQKVSEIRVLPWPDDLDSQVETALTKGESSLPTAMPESAHSDYAASA